MSKKFLSAITAACLSLVVLSGAVNADEINSKRSKRSARAVNISVVPWGPSQADVNAATRRVEQNVSLRRELDGSKFRQVGFEYLYNAAENKDQASRPPTHFRVIYYNYSSDMTLFAEGDFAARESISTRWVNAVPGVGDVEISAAYRVVEQDTAFSDLKRANRIEFYEAMPPTTVIDGERLVNIGVRNPQTGENQIVGVSFKNDNLVRYANNAPPTSSATPDACGIANSGQGSSGQGLAGQYNLTVNEEGSGNTLWEMLIVRPSASSGAAFERSGLEIRDVRYKGKSVLKRGHVPLLNVKYTGGCGPFRDWQYSEGDFQIPASGVTFPGSSPGTQDGGFAVISSPGIATTSVETRNDTGNFRGVAVYTQNVGLGTEVVLVTEMNAGWYRYIMEWRFGTDGTIRPRYGFGSVTDSCVCIQRIHHVYWRFDFDIVNANNKIFQLDRGRKFLKAIDIESEIFKNVQRSRSLLIQNSTGDEAYQLVPGLNDGSVLNAAGDFVDVFGAGDFWLTRFKGTPATPGEIDDLSGSTYPAANLSPWVNGESLVNQDVVVWYAAHQTRSDDASRNASVASPEVLTGNHVVGPTLRPVRW